MITCYAQLCFIPLEGRNKNLAPKIFHIVESGTVTIETLLNLQISTSLNM